MTAVPPRFAAATLEGLAPTFDFVRDYARDLRANLDAGRGLLISGSVGTGKTHALAALVRHYEAASKTRYAVFSSAYEVADRFAPVVGEVEDLYRHQPWTVTLSECRFLVVDDVGRSYRGGKLAEQEAYRFGRLVRTRSQALLVTCVTTNLPLRAGGAEPSLREVYGEATWSLLCECTAMHEVAGPDRRRARE